MERRDKERKSAHLKELEAVFEERTRRFSPFAILGLTAESSRVLNSQEKEEEDRLEIEVGRENAGRENERPTQGSNKPTQGSDEPTQGSIRPTSISEKLGEREKISQEGEIRKEKKDDFLDTYNRPSPGSDEPTPGSIRPVGGVGRPTSVVVVNKYTTTIKETHPGVDLTHPPRGGPNAPTQGSVSQSNGSSSIATDLTKSSVLPPTSKKKLEEDTRESQGSQLAGIVIAGRLGGRIGTKARKVLAYLNSIRSFDVESCTVPVGYSRISETAEVDTDYLRRKVLPKLAMLGLIAIERKGLDGTIYRFPHTSEYIRLIADDDEIANARSFPSELSPMLVSQEQSGNLPEWVDKERWGWLSPDTVQRLIEKSGSEAKAKEKLDIIVYNENHGSSEQRVRNIRSVLAHYLSSPQAEIWPNDDGFETLELRQARLARDRARQEKLLAEEALQAQQETARLRFVATLSETQRQWLKQEARRLVDARPEARFLKSRYLLYKSEEDKLTAEWMDRTAYGEEIPNAEGEESVRQHSSESVQEVLE